MAEAEERKMACIGGDDSASCMGHAFGDVRQAQRLQTTIALQAQAQRKQARVAEDQSERERRDREREYENQEKRALIAFEGTVTEAEHALLNAAAKKRGFNAVRTGLAHFLEDVQASGTPMSEARTTAIQLSDNDEELVVTQVLGSMALIVSDDLQILVHADKSRLYENTPLTQLGALTYRLVGVRSYRSMTGLRQAFEVRPIADFEEQPKTAALIQAVRALGGPALSLLTYAGFSLVECARFPNAQAIFADPEKAKSFPFPTRFAAAQQPCEELFARPPLYTCLLAGGISARVYSVPKGFHVVTEEECAKLNQESGKTAP